MQWPVLGARNLKTDCLVHWRSSLHGRHLQLSNATRPALRHARGLQLDRQKQAFFSNLTKGDRILLQTQCRRYHSTARLKEEPLEDQHLPIAATAQHKSPVKSRRQSISTVSSDDTGVNIDKDGKLTIVSTEKALKSHPTALIVSSVSTSLVKSDFTRLLPGTLKDVAREGGVRHEGGLMRGTFKQSFANAQHGC